MNFLPWRRPWPVVCRLVPSVLWLALGVTPVGAQQSAPAPAPWPALANQPSPAKLPMATDTPTLKQALEAAWQRSTQASESQSRQARTRAEQDLSERWWAGAPAVGLSQRESRPGSASASRDTELMLAVPLWRPGQQSASEQTVQAQRVWGQALEQAQRWRLVSELRQAQVAVALAQVELQQAQRQAQTLEQLADDVQRRVRAGDLAPADALAARAEALAADAQVIAARQVELSQQASWRLLTGLSAVAVMDALDSKGGLQGLMDGASMQAQPPLWSATLPANHPEQLLADAAVALYRQRVALVQAQRPQSPELTVGLRQERIGQGAGSPGSVLVGVRWPLGDRVDQLPQIASAQGDLDLAQRQAQRLREQLDQALALARSELAASQHQQQAHAQRAALLAERARLIEKSFQAGESPLPELLRALSASALAETSLARQRVLIQAAQSRLQQALGVMP